MTPQTKWYATVAATCHNTVMQILAETKGNIEPDNCTVDQLSAINVASAYLEIYNLAIKNQIIEEPGEPVLGYNDEKPKIVH
jgi:hypothetical protein